MLSSKLKNFSRLSQTVHRTIQEVHNCSSNNCQMKCQMKCQSNNCSLKHEQRSNAILGAISLIVFCGIMRSDSTYDFGSPTQ